MLSDKMARVQDELGPDFGRKVAFVSITVDPERDTPEVLKEYAEALDADLAGGASLPVRRRFVTWRNATAWPWPRPRTARSTTPC